MSTSLSGLNFGTAGYIGTTGTASITASTIATNTITAAHLNIANVALPVKPKRGYWYQINVFECPSCLDRRTFKTRINDKPRPDKYEHRVKLRRSKCTGCRARST